MIVRSAVAIIKTLPSRYNHRDGGKINIRRSEMAHWIELALVAGIWFFAGWSIGKGNEAVKWRDRIIKEHFDSKED